MITLSSEVLLGAGTAIGSVLLATAKWLVDRAVRQFDKRLDDHDDRIAAIEMTYVDKETLRLAVGEVKAVIDTWGSDMRHGVDNAHDRLDTIYNELLRRGT